jgi:peptidoglycan-associated lipoprotein
MCASRLGALTDDEFGLHGLCRLGLAGTELFGYLEVMKMKRTVAGLACTMALGMLLSACGSRVDLKEQVPVESRSPSGAAGGAGAGAGSGAASQSQVATVSTGGPTGDASGLEALRATGRVVYFDFDSFVVRNDAKPVVEAHAKVLVADRTRRMVIEGHTDDLGGREYNLALGQKRALAVLNSLTLLGVAPKQLEAVSYGKERPAVEGTSDEARAKNRRAEIKDAR